VLWSEDFFDDCCTVNLFLAYLMATCLRDIRGCTFDSVGLRTGAQWVIVGGSWVRLIMIESVSVVTSLCNLISYLQMNPFSLSIWLGLLFTTVHSVLSADESCEVICENSDLCLGAGSGDFHSVCLREMESKLKAALAMVDELLQEIDTTRTEFDTFKVQQAVCGFNSDLLSCILGHSSDSR
jgi:hypothetical protein